ncbi:maleylpyruvate isomerase N-terminal domain-containing protein [Streptomyces luteireticuli]|uniref:maleylpyruvate isomerase N-terminal domain-containing protein n=1 Tax=Streptomyces luteireticuli TaxID=173858 RepID=UPI0031D45320
MEIAEFVETLRREGRLLANAAEAAGMDAPATGCPGWRVRDLVAPMGAVHRWATAFVTLRRQRPAPLSAVPEMPDGALVPWLREGHAALVEALGTAPADLVCRTFRPAPSPLAFWARRQAHETTVDVRGDVTPARPWHGLARI